ncbi:structural protein [Methanoculleus virus Blf4]|uniref:Structural protein n=1 Tax=Methanoculleus virus Blf4 TaxID=3070925 RepID=A0AA48X516_9CAUD|nr:structural protein [Methanoculleus virus L4768]QXM18651.1 structural protein [Methanoculleus virus Blf4]
MTEIYGLFDAADPEAPDRVYTAEAFARLFRTMMRDGIVHNDGDELAVGPTVPAAMSVSVGTGMALIQGRYYINDGDLTLNVEAADPSHPRIDRVVVRLEATPGRTVHAVVKKGTPAPSPVPPGLTRTAETWELSLAQIRVEAGATSILSAKITDERGNSSLCGVAAPVYVPSSQVEVVGAVDMQGKALTGLPAPSGATDAATKGYADTLGSLSGINIDTDKDWMGHNLSNLGEVGCAHVRTKSEAVASDNIKYTNPHAINHVMGLNVVGWKKYLDITITGDLYGSNNTFRAKWKYAHGTDQGGSSSTRIYVNGVPKGEIHSSSTWLGGGIYNDVSEDIPGIKAGDRIELWGNCTRDRIEINSFKLCADYRQPIDVTRPPSYASGVWPTGA